MPPVRWKLFTDAQIMRDTVPMTSDGWRPIIGTHKPHFYDVFLDENENIKSEIFSTLSPTQTYLPTTLAPTPQKKPSRYRGSAKPSNSQGRKKNPHSKHSQLNPYFALPTHGTHGPHIPLSAVTHTRPSQIGQIKKHPPSSKPFMQPSFNGKRNVKPMRIQTSTHSHRDDIFTASATSGAYSIFNQSPNNIKTREVIGLGLPASNHFSINQPHAHIEFTNRFALPPTSESVFQQYNNPVQGFIFPKHPQTNDVNYQFQNQNDEYTRNLVPPPNIYKSKESNQVKETQEKTQLLIGKPSIPENVLVQLPSPYQFSSQKINEPTVTQVQVTKEKLNVFHNNIPPNYSGDYVDYDFHSVRKPTELSNPTYEVTEGKIWQETPPYTPRSRKPTSPPKRRPAEVELNTPPFLPTPYRPEGQAILPTSPTQSEVSTIFTKLSKIQREKEHTTPNPFSFDVKEVSTHYPVFGKPIFDYNPHVPEISNEITTRLVEEEVTTTTRETPRIRPHRRRRPEQRRTTTTTTEEPVEVDSYDSQRSKENEASESVETERPIRRRPIRYRTTTPSSSEISEEIAVKTSRGRNRYRHRTTEASNYEPVRRRVRPTRVEIVTEMPENHKTSEEFYRQSTEATDSEELVSEKNEEVEMELPERHYITEQPKKIRYETIRPFIEVTTTEKAPTTNLIIPENEIDSTSEPPIEEIIISTTPPTTTTTTTLNPHRIRGRPIKFDNSNRPRFSVKEYRQKLSHYSSTASPETSSPRVRIPSRLRRPTTAPSPLYDEENTDPPRAKFVPKEPRHSATTEDGNEAVITEKNVKSVNTRLRPFGRHRTTTPTTTTTPKVSIKPNLFSRRRPPVLTLRSKIYNKYSKNSAETTTEKVTTEENDVKETTLDYNQVEDLTTQSSWRNTKITEYVDDVETTTSADISKIDSYLHSQRVSDLTSSDKNDYNTPGVFKSVSPTSRRIPNHFTIATDDPILPIEAFFPNLKDKVKDKDS
ncbi:proteoglycan 4-like [Asbolus verrucosus]|uniref:Proteoglycan 4-like n=1 Tax=Asbolus verrucosus TaxID=1661398 RepID=A0A482W8R8_ASBVE|nr:proteoglycan 4-like [Asbolus verrucosus]